MAAALEPKPDAFAPKPPLLRSSEETPVYLEAFALACMQYHVQLRLKLQLRAGFKAYKLCGKISVQRHFVHPKLWDKVLGNYTGYAVQLARQIRGLHQRIGCFRITLLPLCLEY